MSSFTIENILRRSDELRCNSTSSLDFEKFHKINRSRSAEIPVLTSHHKRPPLIIFSNAYDHRQNTPHCESTSRCDEMEKKGCKKFCNAGSFDKQRNSFNTTSMFHSQCCCFTRVCNSTISGIGEYNKCLTESYKRSLRNSLIIDQNAGSEGRYLVKRPIPLFCGNSVVVDNENEVRGKQEKIDMKYDWMVNPRPFYRKGDKIFTTS